jgi:small subunit ribosomal protein S2
MAESLIQDLIEAGIHFGQRASNWNPKMAPYIYDKRNQIHIIDIKETVKGLLLAKKFLARVVSDGKDVCFVGTKRQAKSVLEQHVGDVGMHWVTERWLGGTLTNHRTIRTRLKRLAELEELVETGDINNYSKKMESQLLRQKRQISRNLSGVRDMNNLPGAVVVIDVRREINAVREARKLGIPTLALIDTDGDPDLIDIPIPGNDDSMRSIDVVVRELCKAISEGKTARREKGEGKEEEGEQQQAPRRRSSRARYRADEESPAAEEGDERQEQQERPAAAEQPVTSKE